MRKENSKEIYGIPRNTRIQYRFKRQEFDFMFQWMAGAQTHGCTEVGELLYGSAQIREGDVESWVKAWMDMGRRVEQRAETSLDGGHKVSARESYLRAYAYYRAGLVYISPIKEPKRYREQYNIARERFCKAAALFDPPIEVVSIPFEGGTLPGYYLRSDDSGERRKTLIMVGGGDTFVEDLYGYIGPAAMKRGYNLLIVDFPGQGQLPFEGLQWRTDTETPMKHVVDFALSKPEVDPERLAAYGLSGGGYIVPRAATCEKRLKAIAACCILLEMESVWNGRIVKLYRQAEHSPFYRLLLNYAQKKRSAYFTMIDTYIWRWGARSLLETVERSKDMHLDPALITCPTLNLVSEQEYVESPQIYGFAQEALQKINTPNKKLMLAPQDEGGDSHGIGANLSLMSQIVFDWFDEIFEVR
jgi:alpha-beta hydrolase superfamily lysophospholipase